MSERVTNGSFCDYFTGWSYDAEDTGWAWYPYAGPDGWIDWVSCAFNGYIEGSAGYKGVWQSIDLSNVDVLTLELWVYLYNAGGYHTYSAILIDDVEVYRIDAGDDEIFYPSIDTSSYSGPHTVKFVIGGSHPSGSYAIRLVSAIGPDLPPPPVAAFEGFPTSGDAPLLVLFTDESTNSPTSWLWDFGDGFFSNEQNPFHTYATPGVYDVSLHAYNAGGDDLELKPDYMTVTAPPTPPPTFKPLWKIQIGEL